MSYLQKLGLGKAGYDKTPYVPVKDHADACWCGWKDIAEQLGKRLKGLDKAAPVLAVEAYTGLHDDEIIAALAEGLSPARFVETEKTLFKSETEIEALVAPDLGGDDPLFGRISRLTTIDFMDADKRAALKAEADGWTGLTIVYGPGALLCCEPDLIVYADMPRWEHQMRQRRNEVRNLGVENKNLGAKLQYKRSFFIDWRVGDKLKRATFDRWDYYLETVRPNEPKLISGEAFRAGLACAARRPFRVVPFFDPGVWGGRWMKEVCDLPDAPHNFAWCFDCVPEENSLLLGFGETRVEIPSINLVFRHPKELLGEPVYGRFGAEFPIRFDFLDTMGGQNLSFQVHPLIDYAYEHFGLRYTQDESYYILDAEPDAGVYLGLKEDVEPEAMIADLATAAGDPERPFPDEKHVARFPAKKHDHFLIPAGTCHCSGANSMVLEISHTPYIFTFKLWDWDRLDLDGKPRPINLERGAANIQWDRREKWVEANLINQLEAIDNGDGWREERTGLYPSEFIETRRHWFTKAVDHDTGSRSVNVINLVQGEEAIVESPTGAFTAFVVHYAETFIIPAAVGRYTIRPHGAAEGKECATLKAFVRVSP
ncbi:MAG: mannose-6-phosphate isomerase [Verrucomicrobia bacterium]|jgi:mannose-6-phosphate isomerase class I|nr:mannose-6-phosphate isomerase [Verrucomicrobiota bacterium]